MRVRGTQPDVSFSVLEPSGDPSPLIVEVPHAGLRVDPETLAGLIVPASALGNDADLYVDRLFAEAPKERATLIAAQMSRYVVDLNREESEIDGLSVKGGPARLSPHGLIWHTTTEGRPALAGPLSRDELERRLELFYRPYHDALSRLIEDRRERFGHALLLCAHSMPSRGREGHADPGHVRADLIPGSRGRTTAAHAVIDLVDRAGREAGFQVVHDDPYRGGYSTAHYGRPGQGVHAIQIELNRRLYMDEATLAPLPTRFDTIRAFCRTLCQKLAQLDLSG